MSKLLLGMIVAFGVLMGPASAENQKWNVTEESSSGLKAGQGVWSVNTDPEGKIAGTAGLQLDNGKPLTYTIAGSVKDSLYTIEMSDRATEKRAVSGMDTCLLAETNRMGSSAQPSATAASNSSYALDSNCGNPFC